MTQDTLISLEKVSHGFTSAGQDIDLFNDIDLTIRKGQTASIVGASGSGKSSLLSIMAGLEAPKLGTVRYTINGSVKTAESFRLNTGFIFQQFHLLPEMDALHNLALPLRLKGCGDAFEQARHWLDRVDLSDRASHKPNQLSGGEQQRVAIARAFISAPDFIFADEPTGNLDVKTAQSISSLMIDCARETQCGLILVTHSHSLAQQADQQFALRNHGLEAVS